MYILPRGVSTTTRITTCGHSEELAGREKKRDSVKKEVGASENEV